MVWAIWRSNPGGGEIFRTCSAWPLVLPSLLHNEYQIILSGKSRGVELTTHTFLKPRLGKSKAMPLFPICAFMSSYRVKFTLSGRITIRWLEKKCILEPYSTSDYHHAISVNNNVYVLYFNSLFFVFIYIYVALIRYKIVDPQNAIKYSGQI
jgi:hypothetical protein